MEPLHQRYQKSTDSGSKWSDSDVSYVNTCLIRIIFGLVSFGCRISGALSLLVDDSLAVLAKTVRDPQGLSGYQGLVWSESSRLH